jgi:predicted transcriptional regulator
MTKFERLHAEAASLSDAQIEDLIAVARYLKSVVFRDAAPAEVLASIDRGIADAEAGRTKPGTEALARLRALTDASSK